MAIICPTVLASNEVEFKRQIEVVSHFSNRIQIDLTDGIFAINKTIGLDRLSWPNNLTVDIHLMYQQPIDYIYQLAAFKPNLVITHSEASGNFYDIAEQLKSAGIKVGLALLPQTEVLTIKPIIDKLDHALVFSGSLGSFGGQADFKLLKKVQELKSLKPGLEVGWDGGINEHNAKQLANGGVDILNVGGAIQKANNPAVAYVRLKSMVGEDKNGSN